jgi:hypothetical protein
VLFLQLEELLLGLNDLLLLQRLGLGLGLLQDAEAALLQRGVEREINDDAPGHDPGQEPYHDA